MEEKVTKSQHFWLAIALISLGLLFLLDNFNVMNIGALWRLWPLIFMYLGFMKLKSSDHRERGTAYMYLSIGALFFLISFNILDWDDIWQFWPVILILVGLSMIYKKKNWNSTSPQESAKYSDDRLDIVAIFGGSERIISSDKFEGGNITAICGGGKIDLGRASLAEGESVINILAVCGGAEILVPSDWDVRIKALPIFGGYNDSRHKLPTESTSESKVLVIKGFVMFGGFQVKNA